MKYLAATCRVELCGWDSEAAGREVFDEILRVAPKGTVIPKPCARGEYIIKGLGTRRREKALIYTIPNHKNPQRPYEKGVTVSEVQQAYSHLVESGVLTHQWFKKNLPGCSAEGGCNFTIIGGLFVLLGEAEYEGPGTYRRVECA